MKLSLVTYFTEKSDSLDLRAEKSGYVGLKFGLIFLPPEKKVDRHFEKGFNVVMDEVELFDFFIEKSDFLDLRAEKAGYVGLKFGIIFLNP